MTAAFSVRESRGAAAAGVDKWVPTVMVTVYGALDDRGCELLGAMLADLIEGHGSHTVAVDLTEATAGPATASVLTEAGLRARRLCARLIVTAPPRHVVEALASREWGELIEILPGGEPQ